MPLKLDNEPIHRHLVRYRVLSISVMGFCGYLMLHSFHWVTAIPHEQIGVHHAALIAAVYAPVTGIFKFAFDFALDGKIDSS